MTTNSRTTPAARLAVLTAVLSAAAALPGCRGDRSDKPPRQFFPDLDDQMKWKPQGQSPFFADGRTMRQPPKGSVAFGRVSMTTDAPWGAAWTQERADLLKDDARFYAGTNADGTYVERIPVEVDAKLVARGRDRYNIYCVVCHGYAGDGKGMVGVQWGAPLPNYHDAKYITGDPNDAKSQKHRDGFLFHTARNGVPGATPADAPKMPGYAHALTEHDAWAVVSYIRALQEARNGALPDVPDAERQVLERTRTAAQNAQNPPAESIDPRGGAK